MAKRTLFFASAACGVRRAACNTDSDDDIVNLGAEYRDVTLPSVAKEELSIVAAKEEAVICESSACAYTWSETIVGRASNAR